LAFVRSARRRRERRSAGGVGERHYTRRARAFKGDEGVGK